jgi:thiol-disulfide isomerase/thioredoxin
MNLPTRVLVIALLAGAAQPPLVGHAEAAGPVEELPVAIGKTLPDMPLTGLNGPSRSPKSYAGRRLIINVWASWCGPCRAEAASLERFAWSDQGLKYSVIGISTDDDHQAAARWLKQSNATLTHFIDRNLLWERALGASAIPLTVLIDERGRVVSRVAGAKQWDSAESSRFIERAFLSATSARSP